MASNDGFSRNARVVDEVAPSRGVSQEMPEDDSVDQSEYDEDADEGMTEEDSDAEESTEAEEEPVEEPAPKRKGAKAPTEEDLNKLRSAKDKEVAEAQKELAKAREANKKLQEQTAALFKEQAEMQRMAFEWSISNDPPDVQQQKRIAFQAQQRENLKDAQLAAKDAQISNLMDSLAPMAKRQVLEIISEQTGVPVDKLMEYDDPKVAEAVAKVHASYQKEKKTVERTAKKRDVFEGGGSGSAPVDLLKKYRGSGDIQGYLREKRRLSRR